MRRGALGAGVLWPAHEPERLAHTHDELPADHPHLIETLPSHAHDYIIDALHPRWPRERAD